MNRQVSGLVRNETGGNADKVLFYNMKRVSVTVIAMLVATGAASGASLTNKDPDSHTVIVTEGGVKNEFAVASGETITFCDNGCFLTLPNGDRAALAGSENVEIVDGEAVIK
ncbi:MAG: hypothetical protein Kow0026_16310 [Oricola sp.]